MSTLDIDVPVLFAAGSGRGSLRTYRFFLREFAQPDDLQVLRPVSIPAKEAEALQSAVSLVVGEVPDRPSNIATHAVSVAATWPSGHPQRLVSGDSSMLGAALGFLAVRLLPKDRWAPSRPVIATGALAKGGGGTDKLANILVAPVEGILGKLEAIRVAGTAGALILLPPSWTAKDAEHEADIAELIDGLRAANNEVRQVATLRAALEAWPTPLPLHEMAAAAEQPAVPADPGVGLPRRSWVLRLWPAYVAMLLALGVGAAVWHKDGWLGDASAADGAAGVILADPETRCAGYAPATPQPQGRVAEALAICAALARCETAAGHPLDPDLRAAGRRGGISAHFLADPARAAAALAACAEAIRLAPAAVKPRWHLARALEAQAENDAAQRQRDEAIARGEPMSRLRAARDALLLPDSADRGRIEIARLAARQPPPPEAVYWYGIAMSCGLGGPRDPAGAATLVAQLRSLASHYADDADFPAAADRLIVAIGGMSVDPATPSPSWCAMLRR